MNNNKLTQALDSADALCRERGVRLTDQRKAVLRRLCVPAPPLSAYESLDGMQHVGIPSSRERPIGAIGSQWGAGAISKRGEWSWSSTYRI